MEKRVLITGTNPSPYARLGTIIHQPLIELKPLDDYTDVDRQLQQIDAFDWIVFTSKYAVNYFFGRLQMIGKDTRSLVNLSVASIGKRTTDALSKYGVQPDLQPEKESSEGLLEVFSDHASKTESFQILIPRSSLARKTLPNGLENLGYYVTPLIIYQNIPAVISDKIDLKTIDIIVFTSPSTIVNFRKIYDGIPAHVQCITAGPETEKELKR